MYFPSASNPLSLADGKHPRHIKALRALINQASKVAAGQTLFGKSLPDFPGQPRKTGTCLAGLVWGLQGEKHNVTKSWFTNPSPHTDPQENRADDSHAHRPLLFVAWQVMNCLHRGLIVLRAKKAVGTSAKRRHFLGKKRKGNQPRGAQHRPQIERMSLKPWYA